MLGTSGAPLSKRDGSAGLHDLREQGYLPGAIRNYLLRLGHTCGTDAWLETGAMPSHFDLGRVSRSAAHFDEAQLRHWQREAVTHAGVAELVEWLGTRLDAFRDPERKAEFVSVVRGNLLFPADADSLVAVACGTMLNVEAEAESAIAEAGGVFFTRALGEWTTNDGDFKAWTRAVGAATGRKGAALYMPLRSALTGMTHGPELAPLTALMGRELVGKLLADAARRAGSTT